MERRLARHLAMTTTGQAQSNNGGRRREVRREGGQKEGAREAKQMDGKK